jgi:pyruvate,water dikinase
MPATDTFAPETDPRYELDDPADRAGTFIHDRMHFPFPVCPLFQSIHAQGFGSGYVTAAGELNLPIVGYQIRYRNNYQYDRTVFAEPASEEEAQRSAALTESTLKAQFPIMVRRWNEEHLPQIQELYLRINRIIDADPATIGPEAIDELRAIHRALWTIHFRIVMPQLLAQQVFDEFYVDVMGPASDPHALQVGIYSKTIEAGIALSDLAARARELGLAPLLLGSTPDEIMARLPESESGRSFLDAMHTYLESYGYHQDFFDFVVPTWKEEPAPLFAALRPYLETGRDNRAEHAARARASAAALADVRETLLAYPEPMREQFETLLSFALDANFLHEEHNFYLDQQGLSRIRIAFVTVGKALVLRGAIDAPDDIFMLSLDEARGALAGDPGDLRAVVAERRASFEAAWHDNPPPFLGAPPSGPPPDSLGARAMGRFFGTPPPPSTDPSLVMGTGGSAGTVMAPAYVARTLEDATGVPVGHVLVTVTTTPHWTPLFGIVAAVVTETGGPLSHSAIVAREYAIPAVVGAFGATQRISTGDIISVDGAKGTVRLLP